MSVLRRLWPAGGRRDRLPGKPEQAGPAPAAESQKQLRATLLELLPRRSVGAEIGVHLADFSAEILRIVAPACLHLVDPLEALRRTRLQRRGTAAVIHGRPERNGRAVPIRCSCDSGARSMPVRWSSTVGSRMTSARCCRRHISTGSTSTAITPTSSSSVTSSSLRETQAGWSSARGRLSRGRLVGRRGKAGGRRVRARLSSGIGDARVRAVRAAQAPQHLDGRWWLDK